jgi:iron(II)-dependent oxidoreductase
MRLQYLTVALLILTVCKSHRPDVKVNHPSTTEHTFISVSTTVTPPANPSLGDTWIRPVDEMVMIYVPSGQFEMGYSDAQREEINRMYSDGRDEWVGVEQFSHTVILNAFWIDQTEVTNAQFCKFLNERGNQIEEGISWFEPGAGHGGIVYGHIEVTDGVFSPKPGYENHPVIEVSWYGASAYCAWVNGRLPTEAEWEYAARGPDASLYPWGNVFDGNLVNFRDASFTFTSRGFEKDTAYNDGFASWSPVGCYPGGASWCGALDMSGNVWEWVSDWFDRDYYANSPTENPQGPESGTLRIGKGGSWYDPRWRMCAGERKGLSSSSFRMHWIGFRCVVPIHP